MIEETEFIMNSCCCKFIICLLFSTLLLQPSLVRAQFEVPSESVTFPPGDYLATSPDGSESAVLNLLFLRQMALVDTPTGYLLLLTANVESSPNEQVTEDGDIAILLSLDFNAGITDATVLLPANQIFPDPGGEVFVDSLGLGKNAVISTDHTLFAVEATDIGDGVPTRDLVIGMDQSSGESRLVCTDCRAPSFFVHDGEQHIHFVRRTSGQDSLIAQRWSDRRETILAAPGDVFSDISQGDAPFDIGSVEPTWTRTGDSGHIGLVRNELDQRVNLFLHSDDILSGIAPPLGGAKVLDTGDATDLVTVRDDPDPSNIFKGAEIACNRAGDCAQYCESYNYGWGWCLTHNSGLGEVPTVPPSASLLLNSDTAMPWQPFSFFVASAALNESLLMVKAVPDQFTYNPFIIAFDLRTPDPAATQRIWFQYGGNLAVGNIPGGYNCTSAASFGITNNNTVAFNCGALQVYDEDDVFLYDEPGFTPVIQTDHAVSDNDPPTAGFSILCVFGTCKVTDESSDDTGVVTWDYQVTGVTDPAYSYASTQQAPSFEITDSGTYRIVQTVTDTDEKTDTLTRDRILDVPANTTPVILRIDGQETPLGGDSSVDIVVIEDNPDEVTKITTPELPGPCTSGDNGNNTGWINCAPGDGDAGEYTVKVQVVDQQGNTVGIEFLWTFKAPPGENIPPVAEFFYNCNIVCEFEDESRDVDGTVVSWSWEIIGLGVPYYRTSTEQNPIFDITGNGYYDITLTVTDNGGKTDTVKLLSEFVSAAPDTVPHITLIDDREVQANTQMSQQVIVGDDNAGETVTIITTGLPDGISMQDLGNNTGSISGAAGDADIGEHTVTVTAEDQQGNITSIEFVLTVTAAGPVEECVLELRKYSTKELLDEVNFGRAGLEVVTEAAVFLYNNGLSDCVVSSLLGAANPSGATFSIRELPGPDNTLPYILTPYDSSPPLLLTFTASEPGEYKSVLTVCCDGGEELQFSLRGIGTITDLDISEYHPWERKVSAFEHQDFDVTLVNPGAEQAHAIAELKLSAFHPQSEANCTIEQEISAGAYEQKHIKFTSILLICREELKEIFDLVGRSPPHLFLIRWKLTIKNDGDPSDDGTKEDVRTSTTVFKFVRSKGSGSKSR
jgi:PKD repeat protein